MSLDADLIVDRRRMRRKLTFWRVVAIAVIVLAIAGTAELLEPSRRLCRRRRLYRAGHHQGLIRDDEERVEPLERLAQSSTARAVIVHIDSPGGTTAGSEQLYDALMRLKEKKPLVIVVEGMAASGAYITALAGDHIVAKQTSLVGSIGVLFQYPNVSDLLDKVGVKVETIKSSPLKAAPNGFEPTSPEARAAVEVDHHGFLCLVQAAWCRIAGISTARRSAASPTAACSPGTRRIDLKLVDEIGDERTAIAWLAKEKNIDAKLPVRDYKLHGRFGDLPFLHAAAVAMLDAVGLAALAPAASTNWARCRRSSGSILTVCWRFGTLRTRIKRRAR